LSGDRAGRLAEQAGPHAHSVSRRAAAPTNRALRRLEDDEVLGSNSLSKASRAPAATSQPKFTARSAPDGYTMYSSPRSPRHHTFLTLISTIIRSTTYEPVSLVVHIRGDGHSSNSRVERRSRDFIAPPKRILATHVRSPGHGAVPHLSAELFVAPPRSAYQRRLIAARTGIQDLIPGRIDSFFNNIAPMLPLSSQGQMRLLAVTTAKRAAMAPNVPAMAETLPGYDVTGWYALFVAAEDPEGHHPEDVHRREAAWTIRPFGAAGGAGHDCPWLDTRRTRTVPQGRTGTVGATDKEAGIRRSRVRLDAEAYVLLMIFTGRLYATMLK